jgi:hypothetical protein
MMLMLLWASSAEAALRSVRAENTALRPVSMTEQSRASEPCLLNPQAAKPLLLFPRMPDGRIVLLGIVRNRGC